VSKSRRSNIGRSTRNTRNKQTSRVNLISQRLQQNETTRQVIMAQARSVESDEPRNQRLASIRQSMRQSQQRVTDQNRLLNQMANITRIQISSSLTLSLFNRIAFEYDPEIEYCAHMKILIGNMDKRCQYFHALKFKNETVRICYKSGKAVLSKLNTPPEQLQSLVSDVSAETNLFLRKIRKFS